MHCYLNSLHNDNKILSHSTLPSLAEKVGVTVAGEIRLLAVWPGLILYHLLYSFLFGLTKSRNKNIWDQCEHQLMVASMQPNNMTLLRTILEYFI